MNNQPIHFAGNDDHYKLEWVSMVVYSLLKVEQIKENMNISSLANYQIEYIACESAKDYLYYQKTSRYPLMPREKEDS